MYRWIPEKIDDTMNIAIRVNRTKNLIKIRRKPKDNYIPFTTQYAGKIFGTKRLNEIDNPTETILINKSSSVFKSIDLILEAYTKDKSKCCFHVHDTQSILMITILAWLGKYIKSITSGSCQYIEAAKVGNILFLDIFGSIHLLLAKPDSFFPHFIPCNCKMCSEIGDLNLYGLNKEGIVLREWHNLLTLCNQGKYWNNVAKNCIDTKEYIRWIEEAILRENTRNRMKIGYAQDTIRFIDIAINDSLKKARKKYAAHFSYSGKGGKSLIEVIRCGHAS
jgi:hypothetical protein